MKTIKLSIAFLLLAFVLPLQAQTADEIITNYFEKVGGLENLKAINGIKMNIKMNQQGMEFPVEVIQLSDGRQLTSINIQGNELMQNVFDGETLWGTNFMTMKAEKSDAETTDNFKLNINDFPGPFVDYKGKGYTLELLGKETIDSTETFKLKLIKEPIMVDGKVQEDISFYYFDTENFVPIAVEAEMQSGPGKGMTSFTTMSDYQEVDGLYFPFSMSQGVKGQPGAPMKIESIQLNPEVAESAFAFPEVTVEEK